MNHLGNNLDRKLRQQEATEGSRIPSLDREHDQFIDSHPDVTIASIDKLITAAKKHARAEGNGEWEDIASNEGWYDPDHEECHHTERTKGLWSHLNHHHNCYVDEGQECPETGERDRAAAGE